MNDDPYIPLRQMMVEIIAAHVHATQQFTGIDHLESRVLTAMAEIPRQDFVPAELRVYAHADGPLPIGFEKTISQPFITGLMTSLLNLTSEDVVLEIGTGLGYHTALLSRLAKEIYSIEFVAELAAEAGKRLESLELSNIHCRTGNGYLGWPAHAPFDKIIVTAAPELIPPSLLAQLKPGGRMVLPAGLGDAQQLMIVDKDADGQIETRDILPVRFAPLEGVDF